ncbi:MAG: phosphopantetheine-binding protein [Proteobacteria bacterium]|nr:phosphopantetheine-binding protein [Pseudomonadota bacterium]
MEQTEIYSNVVRIISKHAKNEEALKSLNAETHIINDLQVNSARLVDIVLDFEDTFDLEISDDDADKINTIGDAVKLVKDLLH